ncbi:MAG: ATP-binding cassette domain-containing protein, partial [Deltaproteobacteria bacterium]
MPTNCPSSHVRGALRRAAPGLEVWAIVGPTGSGKSSLAMALAQAEGAEIVACDSVQVYR